MHRSDNRVISFFKNVGRTRLIICSILIVLGALSGLALYRYNQDQITQNPTWQCQHAAQAVNPVEAENLCPGTKSWRPDHPLGPEHAIEGFTAPVSANIGERVRIYVSTTAASYTFQVYRMGWYQGLGGRLVYSSSKLLGINQPAPTIDPATRMVSCGKWRHPTWLAIPTTWVSGVYIIKLLSSDGYIRYALFVVRNDDSNSSILFQTSVLTYQAYNLWGGYSLYRGGSGSQGEATSPNRAYVVSFDRPYDRGDGLGDFPMLNEYNLLRWLERESYDVSYTTDIDTDLRGALLLQHRLFLAAGHDEYWSTAMRNNVTTARDSGVSLAFFGGNDIYWHVRLRSSPLGPDREVVCYKPGYYPGGTVDPAAAINPQEDTVLWRDKPLTKPENALLGEMYGGGVMANDRLVPSPGTSRYASLVLTTGAAPFLSGTSLQVGSAIVGLVGGEYDRVYYNAVTPPSLSILTSSPLRCIPTVLCPANGMDKANATLYTAASGARVFDAGTFYWSWGLDDDSFDPHNHITAGPYVNAAFQQFTTNLLADLLSS